MIAIWLVTLILASQHVPVAILLATWFGQHVFLTILMLIFLA
jgi:hypothetical protein